MTMEKIIRGANISQVTSKAKGISKAAKSELDGIVARLDARKDEWAQLAISEKIAILNEIKRDLPVIEEQWVAAGLAVTEAPRGSMGEAEEWFTLSVLYRMLRMLRASLLALEKGISPPIPGKVKRHQDGHLVAEVMPANLFESLAMPGIRAEVWLGTDGESKDGMPFQAAFYRQKNSQGSLCLVLAAGNVASLIPGDFLQKLFVEGQVVLVKTNPVNANLLDSLQKGFRALIERGYLQIIDGGAQEGTYLVNHERVNELHITGSDKTFEAIVFGPGQAGRRKKKARKPLITKRFTAELGNVSPVIIVPGPWTARDISYQASKIGSMLIPNSGHNCLTPRVLIQREGWPQGQALNQAIVEFLDRNETRKAYYPGSQAIFDDFIEAHPNALQLGQRRENDLPWTFIRDLNADQREDICFNREAFISLFSETRLNANSSVEFIEQAVEFANEGLWGTLTAAILVHPKSLRNQEIGVAVEQAVADLNYGSVTVNHWGALAYYAVAAPWGGAPGQDIYDIQSGINWVNNPLMFDQPIKSVIRAPFRQIPDPYRADSKNSLNYFKRDMRFQAHPNALNLARLLWAAVRS